MYYFKVCLHTFIFKVPFNILNIKRITYVSTFYVPFNYIILCGIIEQCLKITENYIIN